jgi:hypothetical protein
MCLALLLVRCTPGQPNATRQVATSVPTVDAVSQAYVNILQTYYVPFFDAHSKDLHCYLVVHNLWIVNAPSSKVVKAMNDCRDPLAASMAAAQVLQTQLAGATPPARWQAQHTALQNGVQSYFTYIATLVHDIDTGNVDDYNNVSQARRLQNSFCEPIAQINAGPPQVIPPLPGFEDLICVGGHI